MMTTKELLDAHCEGIESIRTEGVLTVDEAFTALKVRNIAHVTVSKEV